MTEPVLWIIPTRGRPSRAAALHRQLLDTCVASDWVWAVDVDDPARDEYVASIPETDGRGFIVVGPRLNLADWTNYCAACFGRDYVALGSLGDDHWPHDRGWDLRLLAALSERAPDGIGFAYGNDLLQGAELPTSVLIWRRTVELLGYVCPPGFEHLMIDVVWRELGEAVGRLFYLDDVIVEHRHPAAGKADEDEGYRRANSAEQVERDAAAWTRYRADEFEIDVRLLEANLGTPWTF